MAHDINSPGVSVQVIDQTTFAATAQGTVSAAVGFAEKGPINEPTLIVSKQAYNKTFGAPVSDNHYMGMFAEKFMDVSVGWFTRIAKEKEYEQVCGTAAPSLDFSGVTTPQFWVELNDFPIPNNGLFRVTFNGSTTYPDLDALVDAINNGFSNVTLPDGSTTLDNYVTATLDETESYVCIRSDNYMNVRITMHSTEDTANDVLGTSGTGVIGIEDQSSSQDVGAFAHANVRVPVNATDPTNASISSSSTVTQDQLNQISAFNLIDLKVDGTTSNPFRAYTDIDITPISGSPATFPNLESSNSPVLSADLSTSSFDITLSGFYDFMSGDTSVDVNTTFTISTTLDGSGTAFTANALVSDLNAQLAATSINANTLQDYVEFEIFNTDQIRLVEGTGGLSNYGSQVSVTIEDNAGDISNLGYIAPNQSESGEDATWTLADVADKINNVVGRAQVTASSDILTIQSQTVGGTSFVEINEATTADESAVVPVLNMTDGQSETGSTESNDGVINFVAKDAGSFGNKVKVRTFTTTNPVNGSTIYNLEVFENTNSVEIFNNVNWTNTTSSNFIVNVLDSSSYVAVDFGETVQYPNSDTQSPPIGNPPNNSDSGNPEFWQLTGGEDGIPTSGTEADALAVQALDAYTDREQYVVDVVLAPGFVGTPVVNKLITLGEARRDILVLVDPPSFLDWKQIIDWHNGNYSMGSGNSVNLNSQYAVATWGWQRDFDPYNEQFIDLPPSIYMAVALARTQSNTELWEAPAGPTRGVVNSISSYTKPTQAQREYLYNDIDPACINPIVQFPSQGTLIYGQKTCLRETKAMNRINVVRLVNSVKRNVENIAQKYLFELSNATTWANVTAELNSYLGNIQERGGFNDFTVVFDASTNTPDRIDQGVMYGRIFIQPVRVAERIFIDLTIQNTGAEAAV